MADDATLALLQEIRDLQKQQLEHLRVSVANQQQSLANQQQSLSVQQQVVERQKTLTQRASRLWIFVLLGVFVLFFLQFFPFFFRLLLGHSMYR
jgi:hypothetical protein